MRIQHHLWVQILSIIIFGIAALLITAWAFDIHFLKGFSLNRVSMKPNTALGFLLCAFILSGWFQKFKHAETGMTLIILGIGLLTMMEYFLRINLGIDEFLFKADDNAIGAAAPGRMGLIAAINFGLTGASYLIPERKISTRQAVLGIVFITSLFSLYAHLLNLAEPSNVLIRDYIMISVPDAICFILTVICSFFKTPDKGFSNLFFSHGSGAVLLKRLLAPIFFILPAIFYLRLIGERSGWYDTAFGINIMIVTSVVFIFALIIFAAVKLNRMESGLKMAEADLRTIFENTIAGFVLINNEFIIRELNPAFQKFAAIAWKKAPQKSDNLLNYIPREKKKVFLDSYKRILDGECVNYEVSCPWLEDTTIFFNVNYNPVRNADGKTIGCCIRCEDISESNAAKEKLRQSEAQLRNLTRHLNNLLEEERISLAREIHDELGQQLVGIKIGLSTLLASDERNELRIKGMMQDVDETIQSLRKIATELRPGILDSLGLIPSIKWLATEFERKTNVRCLAYFPEAEKKYEKPISTCFFRICQEALTNITKHACATEVIIEMTENKSELMLRISDNGKGIAKGRLENPFSMGLLGMKERAAGIGGDLRIESEKNEGTDVILIAPIN